MMDDREREVADTIYAAIQHASSGSERTLQAKRWRVGISDLGYCSERTRRMLMQESPEDTDYLTAFIGTAVGDHVEQAVKRYAYPDAILQADVKLVLVGSEGRTYTIPGHPDIIVPGGLLLDVKTAFGLSLPAKTTASDRQKRFQRHNYAKAAADTGLFKVPLADVMVGNVFIDRSGTDKYALVNLEPYDPDVTRDATEWLEEVIYCYTNEQVAPKEPPREVCAKTCGFFATCRAYDTDVAGLLTDEEVVAAIAQYEEGKDLARIGKRLQDQAKPALAGVEGYAQIDGERFALRWTHINASLVPEYERKGYDKIDLKKVK